MKHGSHRCENPYGAGIVLYEFVFIIGPKQQSPRATLLGLISLARDSGYIPGQCLQSNCQRTCDGIFLLLHHHEVEFTGLTWMLSPQPGACSDQIFVAIFAAQSYMAVGPGC